MANYTNSFTGCTQCCTCPLLPTVSLRCPALVPANASEFCFLLTVTSHNITGIPAYVGMNPQWAPPATFTITGYVARNCLSPDHVTLLGTTSIPHPQDPVRWPHMIAELGFINYSTNPPQYLFGIPFRGDDNRDWRYQFERLNATPTEVCSPYSMTLRGTRVTMSGYYNNIYTTVGTFSADVQITPTTCPAHQPALASPLVAQATQPCVYLGNAIEDPNKCGCGTANLMACALYGTCRRTGTPTAGEQICLVCPDYKKA